MGGKGVGPHHPGQFLRRSIGHGEATARDAGVVDQNGYGA